MDEIVSNFNDEFECLNGIYKLKKRLHTPDNIENSSLIKVYVEYFRSSLFLKLSLTTRYMTYRSIQGFITWLGIRYDNEDNIPNSVIYPIYFNYLNDKNVPSSSIMYHINTICKPLVFAKQKRYYNDIWDTKLHSILLRKPVFKNDRARSKPQISLSQLGNDKDRFDTSLIESLRLVTQWFLSESQRQRELLLNNAEVVKNLNLIKNSDINKPPFSHLPNGSLSGTSKHNKTEFYTKTKEYRKLYYSIIKAAIELDDDCLIERIAYSKPSVLKKAKEDLHSPSTFNKVVLLNILKSWLTENDTLNTTTPCIDSISFADLVVPSDSESLAMMMFLASDRIQKSGLVNLELNDFSFEIDPANSDIKTVQLCFNKNRSKQSITSTPIYKSTSVVYETYKHWYNLMYYAQNFFCDRKGMAFNPFSTELFNGGRRILHGRSMNFGLLGVTGSILQNKCLQDINNSCFINLLTEVMTHNLKVSKEEGLYEQQAKLARKGKIPAVKRSDFVKTKRKWLSISAIAKSRVEMDEGEIGFVEATLTAHSEEVKAEVYKDRSDTHQSIQRQLKFAEKVGNAMEQDAIKVKALLKKTKVIDLTEIRKALGFSSPSENINETLNQLTDKFNTGLFGEINSEGTTYVLSDPLVAALIISYIKYIDDNINSLANAFPTRVHGIRVHRQFLKEVLKTIPESIVAEGSHISETHEFPFPPLY